MPFATSRAEVFLIEFFIVQARLAAALADHLGDGALLVRCKGHRDRFARAVFALSEQRAEHAMAIAASPVGRHRCVDGFEFVLLRMTAARALKLQDRIEPEQEIIHGVLRVLSPSSQRGRWKQMRSNFYLAYPQLCVEFCG